MADDPQTPPENDEELLLTDPVEGGDPEAPEAPGPDDEGDDEEEVVTFDGDATEPQEGDSALVRHLRKVARDAQREAAEARKSAPTAKPVEVGPKPTLWDEGIDGDEDKYDAAMDAWKERKSTAEKQASEQTQSSEEQQRAFAERLEKVVAVKPQLGADADAAFENVKAVLGEERAAAIIHIADTPESAARLIYALGKYPDRLAALGETEDPLRFVKEVAKLEGQVKVMKRKKVIEPDVPERGSARISRQTEDKKLKKLEEEAEKSGDRTDLIAYKRKLKTAK